MAEPTLPADDVPDAEERLRAEDAVTEAFLFARTGRPYLDHLTEEQFEDLAQIAVAVIFDGRRTDG